MGGGRRRAQEDAFANRYDSTIGRKLRTRKKGEPMMGSATDSDRRHAGSKNELFKRMVGGSPQPDASYTGGKVAHFGKHGAPDIYYERQGGRAGMRGKRGAR